MRPPPGDPVVRRRWQRAQRKDTPPVHDTPHAKAAGEAGGILLAFRFKKLEGENGGCGSPTHVEGTNGGMMPCGSMLTRFGKTEPYFCALCAPGRTA